MTLSATTAAALDPTKAVTQYVHASFGSDSGLPQSSVNAIAQTGDGYLWLGTQDGLARFDGLRFKVFSNHETEAFSDNFVSALFVDRDGILWVGTDGGDLMRYDGARFEALPPLASHSVSIRSITQTDDGAVWVASSGSGAHRWQGKAVTTLTKADGLPDDVVMAVEPRRGGGLWIGTAGGLARFDDGRVTTLLAEENLGSITAFAESPDGALFAGTMAGVIVEIRGDTIARRIGRAEGLPAARITALRVDRDRSLWIGTESAGVLRYERDHAAPFARRHGLTDDTVLALFEDREGSVWIGTEGGGVNALKEARFVTWGSREGLSSDDVSSVLQTRDGSLFFGTYRGGLNRLSGGAISTFSPANGFPSEAVVGLIEDGAGDVWVGSMRSPLFMFRKNRLEPVKVGEALPNQGTRAVYRDASGVIWVGAPRGRLLRYEAGSWSVVAVPDVGTAILALGGDRSGALWVGTYSEGLRRRATDGAWTSLTTADGLSNEMVLGFYEDDDGSIWIPTHRGLNRFKNGHLKAITARDGLYHDAVYQTLEDDDHNFWMCSDRGISRTPRAELDAFADGRLARVTHRSFGIADGMKSVECNNGSPSGVKGQDGRLFFATMGGVVIVDPRATKTSRVPPVLLEQVVADGSVVYAHHHRGESGEGRVRLAPGLKNIEFQYAAPTFADPQHVTTRYRLEGFDRDWIDAGMRRTAYYTSLPPGSYRFAVAACNADRLCSEMPASLELVLSPRFYETRAFYGVGLAAFFAAMTLAWTARTRQLRARAAELEALVAQRTEQLQQANKRLESLAKVDDLTGLANRRRFNASLDTEWRRALRLGSPVSIILIDVDDFKLFNDHYGHQKGDECLREVAAALSRAASRGTDLVARYGGEEFVVLLPETPVAGCRVVAERCRAAVQGLAILHERARSGAGVVTLSAGIATIVPSDQDTPEETVRLADEALYRAKQAGRNRVEGVTERTAMRSRSRTRGASNPP